jgi:hypothetical protein
MGRTVAELEMSLSASEWLGWLHFFAIEPYGTPLLDVIQAQSRALLANINRNEKVRPTPFDAREFLIFTGAASKNSIDSKSADSENIQKKTPELINGLTADEWKLATFLRARQERYQ